LLGLYSILYGLPIIFIVSTTVLEELSITETVFNSKLETQMLLLLGLYSNSNVPAPGISPTGIVSTTVLEELSITDTSPEFISAT
jgi:hypothetical protein